MNRAITSAPSGVEAPSAENRAIISGVQEFLDREVVPRHLREPQVLVRRFDAAEQNRAAVARHIREVRMASARAGFYTMFVPLPLGGGGFGSTTLYQVWEEIFHHCGGRYWLGYHMVAHWTKGPSFLLGLATEEFQTKHLGGVLSGEDSTCFAMSEPDAGSDPWSMSTVARPDGDGWRITGTKQWISNGHEAAFCIVFAVTNPSEASARKGGITAFILPTNSPGFSVEGNVSMFGGGGGDEAVLKFDDVHAGAENVVGSVGGGMEVAIAGVGLGRLYNAARAVGLSRWALELALEYVKTRMTFGKTLSEYQSVTFPLASSAMEVHAAHLVGLNCARLLDEGNPARKELAMAKAFSTEVGAQAVDRAMQALGASGFATEIGLTNAWHQLRAARVADGTTQILTRSVVRSLLGGDLAL